MADSDAGGGTPQPPEEDPMCPGDTDFCPHGGCTTCQGPLYYFPDPNHGAGRIDERDEDAWRAYVERHRQRVAPPEER